MSDNAPTARGWRSYPGAPVPGTPVCALADIQTIGTKSVELAGYPLLLVRGAAGLRGFVNACPHQFLPLDWRSDNVLSPDGKRLRCSNHDAGFDAASGEGIDGHGAGCALDPVPLAIQADMIVIGDQDFPEGAASG